MTRPPQRGDIVNYGLWSRRLAVVVRVKHSVWLKLLQSPYEDQHVNEDFVDVVVPTFGGLVSL